MDFIIGREPQENGNAGGRWRIISKQTNKTYFVGYPRMVSNAVSREHCLLSVDPGKGYTSLRNLKANNATFVNGLSILDARVTPNDFITLGGEGAILNLNEILEAVRAEIPRTYDISHLEQVYNKYKSDKMAIQVKQNQHGNARSVTGALSMVAIMAGMIPNAGSIVTILRYILYAIAIIMNLYFLIDGFIHADRYPKMMDELDQRFHRDYVCPDPECQVFLGYTPYSDLIRMRKVCPYCHSQYQTSAP